MSQHIFTGAGVAIVTPMNPDSSINYEQLGALIDWQIANKTDAIVSCGTTGESATMTDQEHIDAISFTVRHVNKRVPVIAGAGSNDTRYAIELSKEAKNLGVDALLHMTPYYNKTSQKGLVAHFDAVAAATDLPIILYNVPSRTGMNITPDTYHILAQNEKIVATKEASGDISHIAAVIAACGESFAVYSGCDDQIVPIMSLGGVGVISVLSNIMPRETHDICELFLNEKTTQSAALQLKLLPLISSLFSDVNPIPIKEALQLMGCPVGECRLPLLRMEDTQIAKLKDVLSSYGLLGAFAK